jgi:hypothetical protein
MTRPLYEPYYRRCRQPPSSYSGKPISTSPPKNELRTSSGEQSLHQQHRDATRTSNTTSAGRRGLVKRSTPPDRSPLAPEEDLKEANARWTTSSTPSVRTTRTCATPSGTAGFQAFRRARSTLPTSTSSPAVRKARRTAIAPVVGGGRRCSLPAR